jgi:hypothetical protein
VGCLLTSSDLFCLLFCKTRNRRLTCGVCAGR